MSGLNYRDYHLELELSIPDSISCAKKDVWFPITSIDVPTFEVVRNIVVNNYHSMPSVVPSIIKKGVYKIHCTMFIKTENDVEIKKCLETWLNKINDNIYVTSVIKAYSINNDDIMSEEIKCTKTFISDIKEDVMCGKEYIDFTFMCENMIKENK